MQALLAEKAFVLRGLDMARNDYQKLDQQRGGLFVKAESFSPMKLAKLLQDIARAKFEELRLMSFIFFIEEKLRAVLRIEPAMETVTIGSEPSMQPHRHSNAAAAMLLFAYTRRLQR